MNRRIAKQYGVPVLLPDDPANPSGAPGGGGGSAPSPAPTPTSTPGVVKNADGTLTVTEDYIASRAAREKDEGRRAGLRTITDQVDMSPEEIVQFIKDKQAADEAAKSEEQRRADALAAKERETAAKVAALAAKERDVNRRALLVGLGATGQDLDDAAALLSTRAPADADDAATQAAVEKLKADRPELFTGPVSATPTPTTTPAPQPPASQTTPSADFGANGAAEAERRFKAQEKQKGGLAAILTGG